MTETTLKPQSQKARKAEILWFHQTWPIRLGISEVSKFHWKTKNQKLYQAKYTFKILVKSVSAEETRRLFSN